MTCLIGKNFIDFTASAVLFDGSIEKNFNFLNFISGKNCLLFFYPMDFTFVCPSELLALNNRLNEFKIRNVEVVAVSIDSHFVHKAWKNTPVEAGGIGNNICYTLVSDIKKSISSAYNVLDYISGVSYRGSFIIDKTGIIRIQHIYDFPIGRNIDEYLRVFDALAFHNEHGEVCQAGWSKGASGIIPSLDGISNFLASSSKNL